MQIFPPKVYRYPVALGVYFDIHGRGITNSRRKRVKPIMKLPIHRLVMKVEKLLGFQWHRPPRIPKMRRYFDFLFVEAPKMNPLRSPFLFLQFEPKRVSSQRDLEMEVFGSNGGRTGWENSLLTKLVVHAASMRAHKGHMAFWMVSSNLCVMHSGHMVF